MSSKRKDLPAARQTLSSSKKADLLFSQRLVQLHIVLNMPPFDDLNPYFASFAEKTAASYGYDIGVTEFQQLLAKWNIKAPALLNGKEDVERIMTIMVIWLTIKRQHWLAKCFRP